MLVEVGKGHQLSKSSGLVLDLPEEREMGDTILRGLHRPVHNGCGGADTHGMGLANHACPGFCFNFTRTYHLPNLIDQDLRSSSLHGPHPRLPENAQHFPDRPAALLRGMHDLIRASSMDVSTGNDLAHPSDEIGIVLEGKVRVYAREKADFGHRPLTSTSCLCLYLLSAE